MPSMQAPASPRRPMRRTQRTRASLSPIARATAAVPSGELSSTNTTSQSISARVRASFSTSSGTLSRSLKVGTTTLNSGAGRAARPGAAANAGADAFIAGGDRGHGDAFQCGWTLQNARGIGLALTLRCEPRLRRASKGEGVYIELAAILRGSLRSRLRMRFKNLTHLSVLRGSFNNALLRVIDGLADPAQRRRAGLVFVLGYGALWFIYAMIAKSSQDINADMGEMVVWTRELALGYPKHPPLL